MSSSRYKVLLDHGERQKGWNEVEVTLCTGAAMTSTSNPLCRDGGDGEGRRQSSTNVCKCRRPTIPRQKSISATADTHSYVCNQCRGATI